MKNTIKKLTFLLFLLTVLYLGIREVNYSNYKIIDNASKEVIAVVRNENNTVVNIFGEELILDEDLSKKINNFIRSLDK